MPKQTTHTPVVRAWCQSLGVLTAVSITRQEAELRLAAYVPLLKDRFPDGAFTSESLEHVARQCVKGFPTYAELAGYLSDWWRPKRPFIALPAPPPPPRRPPPTPEEIAHVQQLVREVTAALRSSAAEADAQAHRLDEASAFRRTAYLPPATLDRINPLPNGRKRTDGETANATTSSPAAAVDTDATAGVAGLAGSTPAGGADTTA
jgi:hypothetical protein